MVIAAQTARTSEGRRITSTGAVKSKRAATLRGVAPAVKEGSLLGATGSIGLRT
jgi:hypothetical protein